jgi:hypothetical protein
VPSSYLPTGPEDGSAVYNDGKVGVAYIQEFRFAKYVERLQKQVQEELDHEFKLFLKHRGIEIDTGNFFIEFNKPMNFSSYRELQLESERANLFGQVQGVPFMSNQFKLEKYLGLTEDEIKRNEELWRQENGTQAPMSPMEPGGAGLGAIGVRPMPDMGGDLDMDVDAGAEADFDVDADLGGDIGGEL